LLLRAWRKVPVLVRSSILALAIAFSGPLVWVALSSANRRALPNVPWAAPIMLGVIALSWCYVNGWGPPRSTSAWRRISFRARFPTRRSVPWWLVAIVSVTAGAQSIIFLTQRLGNYAPDAFAPDPSVRASAPILVYPGLFMTSLVAGFFEEAGFRGAMQVSLEKRNGPRFAIVATSIVFYVMHLVQPWTHGDVITMTAVAISLFGGSALLGLLAFVTDSIVPGIAAHTMLDVVSLPLERNVVGGLNLTPVWVTGVDRHFLICCAFLAVSAAGMACSFAPLVRMKRASEA
jgi:membrane protease YdiL (CAAX protease family)